MTDNNNQIDNSRINTRFAEIEKRLKRLKKLTENIDETEFLTNDLLADASERNLEVAIQACLDVANHVVARLGLGLPKNDKKELFGILARNQIISTSLSEKLTKMAGMRNILAHEYLEIERIEIYKAIKNNLPDIVEFVKSISEKFT